MNQVGSYELDILSFDGFTKALIKNWKYVLASFLIAMTLASLYTVVRGRDFESSSKLFIRRGRETVSIDPTAEASGQLISVTDTQDREINSIVSLFYNRDLLEEVVDNMGPEQILSFSDPEYPVKKSPISSAIGKTIGGIKGAMRGLGLLEEITEREEAIVTLRDSLAVRASEMSAVIKVSNTADSPKLAQILNREVIDTFVKYHAKANSASGSLRFFEEQSKFLKSKLDVASKALAEMKIDNNVLSLPVKREVMEKQLMSLDEDLIDANSRYAAAKSKIRELKQLLSEESDMIPTGETEGMANTAKDAMRQQLYNLQIEQSDLRSKYSARHPAVRSVDEKIQKAMEVFDEEEKQIQMVSSINEVHQRLRINLLNERALSTSLQSRIIALKKEREDLRDHFKRFANNEHQMIEQQRQVDLLDSNYRRYVENLEQARINSELEGNSISNVNVVQKPSLVEFPIGMKNLQMFAMGFIFSFCFACAVGILRELYDQNRSHREPMSPVMAANVSNGNASLADERASSVESSPLDPSSLEPRQGLTN